MFSQILSGTTPSTLDSSKIQFPKTESKKHPSLKMQAVQWNGTKDVEVGTVSKPLVTEPTDAVVRVTASTICGSDLHLYTKEFPGMLKGDILGHEGVGIVEEVGPQVKNLKVGDRVAISAVIACGKCDYCQKQMFSLCETTNPSAIMEKMYGHRTSGLFGYSHLTGGYDGTQAEFCRVPFADVNLLKLPDAVKDEQACLLSDVACTSFHATELGLVQPGDVVGIWGAGPIGLGAAYWCKHRGAKRVIVLDAIPYRLEMAKKLGAEVINFNEVEKDVVTTLQNMVPGGIDVGIEAAGFRFPKSILHKVERALMLETDTPEIIAEIIKVVKKGGRISIVGDYVASCNQFPIGPLMEKSIRLQGGQVFVQKYWKNIADAMAAGKVDFNWLITHVMSLNEASKAYQVFNNKEENSLKIILKSPSSMGAL